MKAAPTPPPIAVLRGHKDSVVSLKFYCSSLVVSGAADGNLKVWNTKTLRSIESVEAHSKSILSINIVSDSKIAT